jgi:hypothetical protein
MPQSAIHRTIIHRHSGWVIPLGFAAALLLLIILFLTWYLRPGPRSGAPSGDTAPVALTVGGLSLSVPANHIETPAARAGGTRDTVTLFALYPSMRGYTQADAALFANNRPDSNIIHLLLRADPNSLEPLERLARIYRPHLTMAEGAPGPFGLLQYAFRPDSPYAGEDLYVAPAAPGPLLFLCQRVQPGLPSPNCIASASPLAENLSFSWRFKRAHLSRWRDMAPAVDGLMTRFGAR